MVGEEKDLGRREGFRGAVEEDGDEESEEILNDVTLKSASSTMWNAIALDRKLNQLHHLTTNTNEDVKECLGLEAN